MPISEISRQQFERLELPDACRALWERTDEVNWFADEGERILGVILFNGASEYWGYVMCARVDGSFKRLAVGSDFPRFELAKRDLLASMERHLAASA